MTSASVIAPRRKGVDQFADVVQRRGAAVDEQARALTSRSSSTSRMSGFDRLRSGQDAGPAAASRPCIKGSVAIVAVQMISAALANGGLEDRPCNLQAPVAFAAASAPAALRLQNREGERPGTGAAIGFRPCFACDGTGTNRAGCSDASLRASRKLACDKKTVACGFPFGDQMKINHRLESSPVASVVKQRHGPVYRRRADAGQIARERWSRP